jgi:hypothetical protein
MFGSVLVQYQSQHNILITNANGQTQGLELRPSSHHYAHHHRDANVAQHTQYRLTAACTTSERTLLLNMWMQDYQFSKTCAGCSDPVLTQHM